MPDISLQQLLSTNFSLSPSGYTGSQGAIGYTGSAGTGGSGDAAIPKITNIQVTDNSYTVLDDTAVALTGGYIKITGTGFASGCQVIIGTTTATSTTFVSATEVRAQLPATTAGTYIVYLVNADGGVAIRINGVTFSDTPSWVTGSTLATSATDTAISIQLSATGASSYALQVGSSLPAGVTLSSSGLLSGTVTGITNETTYTFTIVAIDTENQDSPRTFSITITAGDLNWSLVTSLLSPTVSTSPFNRDASTNNFALTINGDSRPSNWGPYQNGYYSNYFDGSGDYLSTVGTPINFGTGNFTIEWWVYRVTSYTSDRDELAMGGVGGTSFMLGMNNGGLQFGVSGTSWNIVSSITVPLSSWTHCAIARVGSTVTMYINGASAGTASMSTNFTGATAFDIGRRQGSVVNPIQVYCSNLRVVNGTAIYTGTFTPPTTPLTAVANTSLLTCQGNRFVDNSTNNFSITRTGDTSVSGFIPYAPGSDYSTYGSTYFDGTGDYLQTPSSSAFLLTGSNMTIECWFYATSLPAALKSLVTSFNGSNGGSFWMGIDSANKMNVRTGNDASVVSGTTTILPNTWYHMALVKDGASSMKGYLNGVLEVSSASFNWTGQTQACYIASYAGSGLFTGYIADARVVNGTAVYTTAFTPPTAPLTAIANTGLLTCQTNQPVNNNVFLDESSNNLIVTKNGNTTQGTFSPYGENWSNYFDGSGDYLNIATSTAFGYGTGDFTIELWTLWGGTLNSLNGGTLVEHRAAIGAEATVIYLSTSGNIQFYDGPANIEVDSGVTITRQWTHIALSRASGVWRLFINGSLAASRTSSSDLGSTKPCLIGQGQNGTGTSYNGYISNVRIVKGTALYTANFTPSTTPLQPVAGTSLLTCASPTIVDNSANNFAITRNGDVSVQKFGPFAGTTLPTPYYSAYFDGSGDYLTIADNAALEVGSGSFTLECWFYITGSNPANGANILSKSNSSSYGPYAIGFKPTGELQATSSTSGSSWEINLVTSGISFSSLAGKWNHIAYVRSGTSFVLYLNGTSVQAATSSGTLVDNTNAFMVGYINYASTEFPGYISNVRLVNGTAVYTGAFTPPTAPLTAIANTSLLTCQSNTFVDNSTNAFTVTANGNAKPKAISPYTLTYSAKQSYTPAVYGGSMHWGTRTNYLSVPATNLVKSFSGDFTIEAWVYRTDTTLYSWGVLDMRQDGQTANPLVFGLEALASPVAGQSRMVFYNGTSYYGTGIVNYNSWTHIAWVRSGTTLTFYVNGIAGGTATISGTQTGNASTNPIYVGSKDTALSNYGTLGYISDLRITNGTALYTSNFVPQNAPLAAVKNTTLLVNGTSGGIYDSSSTAVFETVGDAKLSTSTVKFSGSTSMYFDGTGDYLKVLSNPGNQLGTGSFTVEFWFNTTATTQYSTFLSNEGTNGFTILINSSASNGIIQVYNGTSGLINATSSSYRDGVWHHLALTRDSLGSRLYIDGTQAGTTAASQASTSFDASPAAAWIVGSNTVYTGREYVGYITDLRITKGIARYTANFTAPATPLLNK